MFGLKKKKEEIMPRKMAIDVMGLNFVRIRCDDISYYVHRRNVDKAFELLSELYEEALKCGFTFCQYKLSKENMPFIIKEMAKAEYF